MVILCNLHASAIMFVQHTPGQKVPWGFDSSRVMPHKVETGKTRVMTSTILCGACPGRSGRCKGGVKPRKAFSTIVPALFLIP